MSDNIIEFGDWRVKKEPRRFGLPEKGKCDHKHLTMDPHGFSVQCDDCKLQLSAYWALERMLDAYRSWTERLQRQRDQHARDVAKNIHLTAAREVEKAWRSRNMVPTCPHCSRGIFPDDGLGGAMVSKEYELARRQKEPAAGVASVARIKSREGKAERGDD